MMNIEHEGKTYRLVGQEQGECLIKCGTTVLLWYKGGKRVFSGFGQSFFYTRPTATWSKAIIVPLPKRYAALVAAEKRLPSSVERAFARGTMAFAVEVE